MNQKQLVERWISDPKYKCIKEKIINLLEKHIQTPIINFELFEGKTDFRGLDLSNLTIKKCDFDNVDFSFSNFKGTWLENTSFKNCLFNKVNFTEFSDHNIVLIDSKFYECNFSNSAIGYDGSIFKNCLFDSCKFKKSIFNRPKFIYVKFTNVIFKSIDFNASSFDHCNFQGELNDVWFKGGFQTEYEIQHFGKPQKNEMINVSFADAKLHDLTFSNDCDLSSVVIPLNGNYYKFDNWKSRLEFLKIEYESWPISEKNEVEIFVKTYMVHAQNQKWQILNLDDIERDYGIIVALRIIDVLKNYDNFKVY